MTKLIRLLTGALAFALTVSVFAESVSFAAPVTETMRVAGIKAPAEILVDAGRAAHLRKSEADVFFLQDSTLPATVFQIDLWRRRGLGQLSEVSESVRRTGQAARLFLYRAAWTVSGAYSSRGTPEAKDITQNFVSGINAYVDWLSSNPDRMPWNSNNWTISPPNGRGGCGAHRSTGSRGI